MMHHMRWLAVAITILSATVSAFAQGALLLAGPFTPICGGTCDPAAVTLFNAMSTNPSPARQILINNAIVSLKAAGIWSECDLLYVLAAADSQAASLNWVNPAGSFNLTSTNSPSFTADMGYAGDGSTSYLSTGWAPSTNGVNYTQNNASLFLWSVNNDRADGSSAIGVFNNNTIGANINPWNVSVNSSGTALQSGNGNQAIPITGIGLFLLDRVTATDTIYTIDQNGANLGAIGGASTALPSSVMRILGTGGSNPLFSSRRVAIAGACGGLSSTQRTQIYSIFNSYMGSIAANVVNYNSAAYGSTTAVSQYAQISKYDQNGNKVDAHAGNIIQVGNVFYRYGESDGCGLVVGTVGPWCGIKVYVSTDLDHWSYRGLLFDPSTWQSACASQANNDASCFSPKIIYNAANNNYVVWLYGQGASTNIEYVFTCTAPDGGATPAAPGTNCTQQPNVTISSTAAEPALCQDASGNGYITWETLGNYNIFISALNSSFTNLAGSPTATGQVGEGVGCFLANGKTYIVWGSSNCAYCTTANLAWSSSSTPLGTYSAGVQINTGSCQGQPAKAFQFIENGSMNYGFTSDQWWGPPGVGSGGRSNNGLANFYLGTFQFNSSGSILAVQCNPLQMIPGLGTSTSSSTPGGSPDQTDFNTDLFTDVCDITSTNWRLQTFIPQHALVASISLPVMQNNQACVVSTSGCVPANGSLTVSLVTLNGSNIPQSTLASQTVTASSMNWAGTWTNFSMNQAVTPGTTYGIEISSTGTVGCIGTAITAINGNKAYSPGTELVSANGGSSWTAEAGRSVMFATY
jgi:hypothetical protein